MSDRDDLEYYIARETRARSDAEEASDIAVQLAHLAAADGYAERIVELRAALEQI